MLTEIGYNRTAAVAYARKWALSRNPAYYDFSAIGGDCTNFASQCLYAGCGVMNPTPVFGWYYVSAQDRTASWTGVTYLANFLLQNSDVGPYARLCDKAELQPGDLVQLGDETHFYHTPVVLSNEHGVVRIAAHSDDRLNDPLSVYRFERLRCLHIEGCRTRRP